MEEKKTDFNSSVNQDIKGKFVNREVFSCVTDMVEELITLNNYDCDSGINIMDFLNYTGYSEILGYEIDEAEKDEEVEKIQDKIEEIEEIKTYYISEMENDLFLNHSKKIEVGNSYIEILEAKIDELEDMEFDILNEPMEYWIVSGWFGEKLKENGQITIDEYYGTIWGRCSTGQSILLDNVISEICSDMGILEGQPSDWSKQK